MIVLDYSDETEKLCLWCLCPIGFQRCFHLTLAGLRTCWSEAQAGWGRLGLRVRVNRLLCIVPLAISQTHRGAAFSLVFLVFRFFVFWDIGDGLVS